MDEITIQRFKPYRKMRWLRSNYLWQPKKNNYLSKYKINVQDDEIKVVPDILAIPCPHVPGREQMAHRDDNLWIGRGYVGSFDYQDMPILCDSSMDYAYLDTTQRELLSFPQVRAYLPNIAFRDDKVQRRSSWGGTSYGTTYIDRTLHGVGPSGRYDRTLLPALLSDKVVPPFRPPTEPFDDKLFEYIAHKRKPLAEREIDIFFSGRVSYYREGVVCHPSMSRKLLEKMWPKFPGNVKVFKGYSNFDGTRKEGGRTKVFRYPYEYIDALLESKIVISPWGWSPWCVRDLEALACGCIVIKPECTNVKIWPDIYNPADNFMVWTDLLFENTADQLSYCYRNLPELQEKADRGRNFVTDCLYPQSKLFDSWTQNIRKISEDILTTNGYSPETLIPDDYSDLIARANG